MTTTKRYCLQTVERQGREGKEEEGERRSIDSPRSFLSLHSLTFTHSLAPLRRSSQLCRVHTQFCDERGGSGGGSSSRPLLPSPSLLDGDKCEESASRLIGSPFPPTLTPGRSVDYGSYRIPDTKPRSPEPEKRRETCKWAKPSKLALE